MTVIDFMVYFLGQERGLQFSALGGRIMYSSCAMVSFRNQRFEILRCAQNDEFCSELRGVHGFA
jgi:hypothetical protein